MAKLKIDDEGNNYLHELLGSADFEDEEEIEEKLIKYLSKKQKNATLSVINQRNKYGQTPLMELLLCHEPSSKIVKRLIDAGCNVNLGDNLSMTPMHKIVIKQYFPSRLLDGEFLGEGEKDIIEEQYLNEKEIMKIICNDDCNVNKQDLFGRSPIFLANDIEVIRLLVKHGADVNMTDKNARTLLHSVLSMPNYQHLFRFYISKVDSKLIAAPDIFGSTPLHYCAVLQRQDMFDELKNMTTVSLHLPDNEGNTPIDILQLRLKGQITTRVKKVDVVHYNEIIQSENASVAVDQLINVTEMYAVLHQPGLGAPWCVGESESIIATVDEFAEYVCKRMGELDTRFKCSLFRSGSSSEGTKVGDPTEFDFVFCLEHLSSFSNVLEVHNKPGFAKLQADDIPDNCKAFFDSSKICKVTAIRFAFSKLLKRIILDKTTWTSSNLQFNGEVRHLEEFDRPVFTIKFRWIGCLYKDEEISVDIVPAFRKKGWWPSDTDFEQLEMMTKEIKDEGCLLLLQNPYFETETLLRISCSPAEKCLIRSLPSYFRESYRLCKLLRHKYFCPRLDVDSLEDYFPLFEAGESITSYMLKNCLFHILSDCKKDGMFDIRETFNEERLVIPIAVKLLRYLDSCIVSETLPVYFIPKREDIFRFNFIELKDINEADVSKFNHFHCLRRRAFLKMMMHIIGQNLDTIG